MSFVKRDQVGQLAEQLQAVTVESVTLALIDQGYTDNRTAEGVLAHGVELEVVKLPEAKRGFVLLPRR